MKKRIFRFPVVQASVVLAGLLLLPSIATAQVWFGTTNLTNRGASYTNTNTGTNNNARVENLGTLYNQASGCLNTATVNGGTIENQNTAFIGNLEVIKGDVENRSSARILNATVDSGRLWNSIAARVENLTTNGGYVENAGTIEQLLIGGGVVENYYNTGTQNTIVSATINDGTILNGWIGDTPLRASLDNPDRSSGYTGGWVGGHIGDLTMNGGSVDNTGSIDSLTYVGGTYNGQIEDRWGVVRPGTIGTLTLAGNSTDNLGDWGIIENLQFADDGSGILSITGFADGSFSGINVTESVNLANGNLQLSLTGSVDDWFGVTSWDALFGSTGAEIGGWETALFHVSWTESDFYTDWFEFGQQWNLGNGYVVMFVADGLNIAAVPEPATLAIIGLGLAGLGLTRRRK